MNRVDFMAFANVCGFVIFRFFINALWIWICYFLGHLFCLGF